MTKEEIKMFILELKDMCDIQMNRDGVHPSHRAGVYDQFDTKLKQLERSDNNKVTTKMSDTTLFADGFENAILGYISRCGEDPIVIYDRDKCINIYMERDGMSEEEAEEMFQFNTEGAWVGKYTPGFLTKATKEEIESLI